MHLASDQKDLLISQLKAEIFEIQQRDKDFLALRDQLYSIQSKYRHLQDEKLLQDNEFRMKHDSNTVAIVGLKKEKMILDSYSTRRDALSAMCSRTLEQLVTRLHAKK